MHLYLKFLLSSSRRNMLVIVVLGAMSGFAGAGLIALVSELFSKSESLSRDELLRGSMALALVVVLMVVLDILARYLLTSHTAQIHRDLHFNFAQQILARRLRDIEKIGVARLITIYTEDMAMVGAASLSIAGVGTSIFVVIGCLGYLLWISPGMLVSVLLVIITASFAYKAMHEHSINLARESMHQRDIHVNQFKSIVHGIKELKLNFERRKHYVRQEFFPTLEAHKVAHVRSSFIFSLGNAWTQIVYFGFMITALLYIVLTSESPAVLGPFLIVALFMRSYTTTIMNAIPVWSRAGVALERLSQDGFSTIPLDGKLNKPETQLVPEGEKLQLEVTDLMYSYRNESDDRNFTIGPLNLTLNSGELIFVVGHNGAGKTTFAKLLSGLFENETGLIKCNGTAITAELQSSYQELFSVIFTDPFIFEQLIISDEFLTSADGVNARIDQYLEKLQINNKVTVNSNRLDSTDLSHGQRKRLALLMASLENKQILIFDEWAENQDPAFKEVFYRELLPELRDSGKLVVVISHESQYFDVADRVITLKAPDSSTSIESDIQTGSKL